MSYNKNKCGCFLPEACKKCCDKQKKFSSKDRGLTSIDSTSFQGSQGVPGIRGLQGFQGVSGTPGSGGSQGSQGSQGPTGSFDSGNICDLYTIQYTTPCAKTFTFTSPSQPSLFATFTHYSINGVEIAFPSAPLSFANANTYLNTTYRITYEPSLSGPSFDHYQVVEPAEINSFTMRPSTYTDAGSTPQDHLESVFADLGFNLMVCGVSGAGYITCDHLLSQRHGTGAIELVGIPGLPGATGPQGATGFGLPIPIEVTGSQGSGDALANLLAALSTIGIIIDNTTA